MTEDEMKQTWCPEARVICATVTATAVKFPGGQGPLNRYQVPVGHQEMMPGGALCLGRQCSAWRWDDVPNPAYAEYRRTHGAGLIVFHDEAPPSTIKSATDGHCGRAGRP